MQERRLTIRDSGLEAVGIIGLGYVGLPLAVAAAESGYVVVGYDASASRVEELQQSVSGVEDITNDRLKASLGSGLSVSSDTNSLNDCSMYVICVPTPLKDGVPDLAAVRSASSVVGSSMTKGDMVILESTTYPGTTEEVLAPLLARESGLDVALDFDLAFSPERIDPGNPTYTLENTPKIVGGINSKSTERAARFYGVFVEQVHTVGSPAEAEMAKLLENTFRHVNIALVNEMAIFSRELGINLHSVIDAAATKPFGFMPFRPGPGVGGHCIPIDPSYLSWRVRRLGYNFRFVELAEEINARMPSYTVTRATDVLNDANLSVRGSRILIVGVAYKPGISDVRETPARRIMDLLVQRGAIVSWLDPHVEEFRLSDGTNPPRVASEREASMYELTIIVTNHPSVDWTLLRRSATRLLDCRNQFKEDIGTDLHGL
jgi:UDP-N-acetyl-D-glucosamine dehydrogenase